MRWGLKRLFNIDSVSGSEAQYYVREALIRVADTAVQFYSTYLESKNNRDIVSELEHYKEVSEQLRERLAQAEETINNLRLKLKKYKRKGSSRILRNSTLEKT